MGKDLIVKLDFLDESQRMVNKKRFCVECKDNYRFNYKTDVKMLSPKDVNYEDRITVTLSISDQCEILC